MISNFFFIMIIIFITLIPIVLWGYLFSYFDDSKMNRMRFIIGICAGWISIPPVLYLQDIIHTTNFFYLDIFSSVAWLQGFSWVFQIFISFFSILFFLSIIPFLIFFWFWDIFTKWKNYIKNYAIFSWYLMIIWVMFYIVGYIFDTFNFFDRSYNFWLQFWNIVFDSLKLVIFYYIIVAILEELSKFFCFYYSPVFSIVNVRQYVLYAIFTALWFAFVENMLYFYKIYQAHWLGN